MMEITTYSELAEIVDGFASGHLHMVVVCSRGGLGKSSETQRRLSGRDIVEIPGHITPLALYERLHNGQNQAVVFDEVDGLLTDKRHVVLLKQLGETRMPKRISWMSSDKRAREIDGGEGSFSTTSPLMLLCNSFTTLNANLAALASRAVVMHFAPKSDEILAKIQTFAEDSEIVEFLRQYHDCLPEFSLRTYGRLEELKRAGLDWTKFALQETNLPPKVLEIADLLARYDSDQTRLRQYSGSRRDYYNWKPKAMDYLSRHQNGELQAMELEVER